LDATDVNFIISLTRKSKGIYPKRFENISGNTFDLNIHSIKNGRLFDKPAVLPE